MLITASRLAYRGPFGRPAMRRIGGWIFYVAPGRPFRLEVDGGVEHEETVGVVAPYLPHRVSTADRGIVQVLVEAETVDALAIAALLATPALRQATAARILGTLADGFDDAADFDLRFFGGALPSRLLDPRIARTVELINGDPAGRLTADDCAAAAKLSFSRFSHLFRAQTGASFRQFRAWKRARGLMPMIGGCRSLVDVALSAGYADSTHFSHSVRQFYGYTPRYIFAETPRPTVVSEWSSRIGSGS